MNEDKNCDFNLIKDLNHLYECFNFNNINDYIKLLKFIYQIYYYQGIFNLVDENIKYSLNTILIRLQYKFGWYVQSFIFNEKNNDLNYSCLNNLISLIVIIIKQTNFLNNYQIHPQTQKIIENYLLYYKQISEEDINNNINIFNKIRKKFTNENIIAFFKQEYDINILKDPILQIKNVKIPNFYLQKKNFMIDHQYEFCHLLFKIYAPLLQYGYIFQEGGKYKINNKDVIFDCGGNLGLFSLYCAAQGAQVYVFEPLSYVRDFLKQSQSLYSNNIHIIPKGVSDKNESMFLYQGYNPGASCYEAMVDHGGRLYKEYCSLISLDNFVFKTNIVPTFIKADIEGMEKEMLAGASKILKEYQPKLNICLNHRIEDRYMLPNFIYSINSNYTFSYSMEGESQSCFVLCQ